MANLQQEPSLDTPLELSELSETGAASPTWPDSEEAARRHDAIALHPIDSGYHAWMFTFCAFVLECLVWGFPFSYGVFQEWYLTHEPFKNASEASLNSVGTVTLAIQYGDGLLAVYFARRYPHHLRKMMQASLAVCVGSMFLSSFSTEVWHLILTQGVVYGIAGGFLYAPVIIWLSEWFVIYELKRRSLASALIFGGTGLGGAIFPPLMTFLLEHVGFRWTLRVHSGIVLLFGGLALSGAKPRLPVARIASQSTVPPMQFIFLTSPVFQAAAFTVFIQGRAYFSVSLYIPSNATALGYSRIHGTLALTVFNLSSVVGQVVFGYYCDRRPYTGVMMFSGVVSSVLAYGLWGFAHTLSAVFWFVVPFASISGGFSSIWTPVSSEVADQPSTAFMCIAMVKGLSAITGPLMAAALHPKKVSAVLKPGKGGWGGYGFTGITIFVGSAMAVTAIMSVVTAMLRQRLFARRQA